MIWRSDNFGAAVIGIALVALWPRLTYLSEVEQSPFWEVPTAASMPYVEAARGEGNAAVVSPLYPLFLRGLVTVGLAPRYVQVLLGAVSCVLLALIGRMLWGPGTGLIAALCAALYGPSIYFTGSLLPPVLAVFLVLSLLAVLLWADEQSDGRAFLGVGVLLALCLLAAPQVALFAPAVLWWLWIGERQRACWVCALGTVGALVLWYFLGSGHKCWRLARSPRARRGALACTGYVPRARRFSRPSDPVVEMGSRVSLRLGLAVSTIGHRFCLGDAGAGCFARSAVCRNWCSWNCALRCPC